jgi:hypothetical protein
MERLVKLGECCASGSHLIIVVNVKEIARDDTLEAHRSLVNLHLKLPG